jgi:hypothetical protein
MDHLCLSHSIFSYFWFFIVIDDPFSASCGGFDLRLCKGDTEFIEKLCDLKECVVFYFLGQIFTGHSTPLHSLRSKPPQEALKGSSITIKNT